jgi:LuxR family transcriptional regulator, maltose regulon positive regulatory protein
VVSGKLNPPAFPDTIIHRKRLVDAIAAGDRVSMCIAAAGYGKTVAVRQWLDSSSIPTAWLTLDLLDDDAATFWSHFLLALRPIVPGLDDEPGFILDERGCEDPLFLGALVAELERCDQHTCVVLDGLSHATSRSVVDGIALLVERVGHLLRFVITGRSDPMLPTARWRSLGWVGDVRHEDLRLTDEEALAVAARFPDISLDVTTVQRINRTVDGWPIGLHLALLSLDGSAPIDAASDPLAKSERLLTDYLVAEVLDRLTPREREVALHLSVVDWFDPQLCRRLAGDDAVSIARQLHRRGMFLSVIDAGAHAMRFHPLFRELLEHEFRWRDPEAWTDSHRTASSLWYERGDLDAAYRHLMALDARQDAHALVVEPALELVDRGDRSALRRLGQQFPVPSAVHDAALALDLATVTFFAGGLNSAVAYCDRAEELLHPYADAERVQLFTTKCMLALMDGDLHTAAMLVDRYRELDVGPRVRSPFDQRFPTTAARVMLGLRRIEDARDWLDRAAAIDTPDIVVHVTVPALRGWLDWQLGDLRSASTEVDRALDWVDAHEIGPHHGVFEALVTGGWCRLGAGDIAGAALLSERAIAASHELDAAWNHLQSGLLRSRLLVLTERSDQALDLVDELRSRLARHEEHEYGASVRRLRAAVLHASGHTRAARDEVVGLADDARTRLLRARIDELDLAGIELLLRDRTGWTLPQRLEAEVHLALAERGAATTVRLSAAVTEAAASGWVLPFLGHGERADRVLASLPLQRLHPALAMALTPRTQRPQRPPGSMTSHPIELTARELTLLELLPTHLSYGQIAERLFLSINTVKTNLKSLYRKLDATSRSEAVEAARCIGLV